MHGHTWSELENRDGSFGPFAKGLSRETPLDLETMQPTITEVQTICKKVRGGCVKLSPAIELEDINCIGEQREVEYIEDRGRVRQGIVWFNELATVGCSVRATSLTANETISGEIETPRISSEIGPWIYEPNPSARTRKITWHTRTRTLNFGNLHMGLDYFLEMN